MNRLTLDAVGAWVCLCVGTVAVALSTVSLATKASTARVAQDEHATCVIQARALPGARLLTGAMSDIAVVLTPQPGEAAPPNISPVTVNALIDLRLKASRYATIQSNQPKTRKC